MVRIVGILAWLTFPGSLVAQDTTQPAQNTLAHVANRCVERDACSHQLTNAATLGAMSFTGPQWSDGLFPPQNAAGKSPVLAGALSFLIPFGTGSFYAGNSGHGVRHLVIGGVALAGMVVSGVSAPSDCDAACTEYGTFLISFGVLFVNGVVGSVVAIIDATHFDRDVGPVGVSVSPGLTVLARGEPGHKNSIAPRSGQVGVRLLQVRF